MVRPYELVFFPLASERRLINGLLFMMEMSLHGGNSEHRSGVNFAGWDDIHGVRT